MATAPRMRGTAFPVGLLAAPVKVVKDTGAIVVDVGTTELWKVVVGLTVVLGAGATEDHSLKAEVVTGAGTELGATELHAFQLEVVTGAGTELDQSPQVSVVAGRTGTTLEVVHSCHLVELLLLVVVVHGSHSVVFEVGTTGMVVVVVVHGSHSVSLVVVVVVVVLSQSDQASVVFEVGATGMVVVVVVVHGSHSVSLVVVVVVVVVLSQSDQTSVVFEVGTTGMVVVVVVHGSHSVSEVLVEVVVIVVLSQSDQTSVVFEVGTTGMVVVVVVHGSHSVSLVLVVAVVVVVVCAAAEDQFSHPSALGAALATERQERAAAAARVDRVLGCMVKIRAKKDRDEADVRKRSMQIV